MIERSYNKVSEPAPEVRHRIVGFEVDTTRLKVTDAACACGFAGAVADVRNHIKDISQNAG